MFSKMITRTIFITESSNTNHLKALSLADRLKCGDFGNVSSWNTGFDRIRFSLVFKK